MNALAEAPLSALAAAGGRRTIPFDYTLRMPLGGASGGAVPGLLQISVEAAFVAVGIGYGFVAATSSQDFGPPPPPPPPVNNFLLRIAPLPAARADVLELALNTLAAQLSRAPLGGLTLDAVLRNGIRINPKYAAQLQPKPGNKLGFNFATLGTPPADLFQTLLPTATQLQFLYAIHDQGSGRSFQSEPILSTAGLGGPDGGRPFRQFATPVQFEPRSTIRIEVTPLQPLVGELHFSLHGYKVLGAPGTPTDLARIARRAHRGVRR